MIRAADSSPAVLVVAEPPSPPRDLRKLVFSQRQAEAWRVLADPAVNEVLYGGARGGGKSILGCLWLYAQCLGLIEALRLPAQAYPIPVAWMGRARAVDCTNTLLETWKQFVPADLYDLRPGDRQIVIGNRVRIDYGGLDDQIVLQKFLGAEYCWLWLDQAEEVTLDAVAALRGSLRRLVAGQTPPGGYKTLWTSNPAPCWLRDEFIERHTPGRRFIPATPRDNPYLPQGYIARLTDAYRHRPEMLAAMLEGRWDVFASTQAVIKPQWIADAVGRFVYSQASRRRVLAVDVARFGDDETVMYGLVGTTPVTRAVHGQKDTQYTANRALVEARRHNAEVVVVDATGIGAGVADALVAMGADVLAVETGAGATDPSRYVNLRAEIWDRAARLFEGGDVSWTKTDADLARELAWPQYEYRAGGRLLIEGKAEIKARMGKSPDYADAYVLGLAGVEWLERSGYQSGNVLRFTAAQRPEAMAPAANSYAGHLAREQAEADRRRRW